MLRFDRWVLPTLLFIGSATALAQSRSGEPTDLYIRRLAAPHHRTVPPALIMQLELTNYRKPQAPRLRGS